MNRADGTVQAMRFRTPDGGEAAHLVVSKPALDEQRPEAAVGTIVKIRTRIADGQGVWESFRVTGHQGHGDTLIWHVEPVE